MMTQREEGKSACLLHYNVNFCYENKCILNENCGSGAKNSASYITEKYHVVIYTSLFAMKGSSRKYKTEKCLTNYSLCTVRQFAFSHETILTVIGIDNNSL